MEAGSKHPPSVVDATSLHPAVLHPPISKSDAQRALVLEKIVGGAQPWLELDEPEDDLPSDVRVLRRGVAAIAQSSAAPVTVDCADGGAPFRILLGQAAVTLGGRVELQGAVRLGQRPHQGLIDALNSALKPAGALIEPSHFWPVQVQGVERPAPVPRFEVVAKDSSQFVTSLLLAAAALSAREQRGWTIAARGEIASEGYVEITLDWLRRAGFSVARAGSEIYVEHRGPPTANVIVPRDWSSAAYLLLVAWRSGGSVWFPDPPEHPDAAIVDFLRSVGLTVRRGSESTRDHWLVTGTAVRGLSLSVAPCPDLALTLAALATVLPQPSVLRDVEILRGKESDRQQGVMDIVELGGAQAVLRGGAFHITPGRGSRRSELCVGGKPFAARGDHRRPMAAATCAVLQAARMEIDDVTCVQKSFPGFWRQLARVGVSLA